MCFTEKQRNFYDQLKKHHFGAGDNCNTIVQICISRQHLLETVSCGIQFSCKLNIECTT